MTGCLNGGSCLFDNKKETITCSCKQPWSGEKCELKMCKPFTVFVRFDLYLSNVCLYYMANWSMMKRRGSNFAIRTAKMDHSLISVMKY